MSCCRLAHLNAHGLQGINTVQIGECKGHASVAAMERGGMPLSELVFHDGHELHFLSQV